MMALTDVVGSYVEDDYIVAGKSEKELDKLRAKITDILAGLAETG